MDTEQIWLAVGMFGQLLFSGRWLLQWMTSEKAGRSVIPKAFWYLSLAGGATVLSYAIYKRDPVFILGSAMSSIIYLRNLVLLYREQTVEPPRIT
ncbi:MAG: lipid A biosynthesis protein [Gammaproteobacteria bacterium]|nr:lipid A biosynthesis protein [Gammaproteobacteria bacterium]